MKQFTFRPEPDVLFLITTKETSNFPKIATSFFNQYGFTLHWKHPELWRYIPTGINHNPNIGIYMFRNYEFDNYTAKTLQYSLESIIRKSKFILDVGPLYWYLLSPPKHKIQI